MPPPINMLKMKNFCVGLLLLTSNRPCSRFWGNLACTKSHDGTSVVKESFKNQTVEVAQRHQTFRARPGGLVSRWRRVVRHFFHSVAQAQWPHVGPYFFDVLETFGLSACRACITPPWRVFTISGPDRVLLLVIDYCFVDGVFSFRIVHL